MFDICRWRCFSGTTVRVLTRHKTLSDGDVNVCLLPYTLIGSDTVVRFRPIVDGGLYRR